MELQSSFMKPSFPFVKDSIFHREFIKTVRIEYEKTKMWLHLKNQNEIINLKYVFALFCNDIVIDELNILLHNNKNIDENKWNKKCEKKEATINTATINEGSTIDVKKDSDIHNASMNHKIRKGTKS